MQHESNDGPRPQTPGAPVDEIARWPPGSRLLQLRPKSKQPYGGAQGNAHLGAVVDAEFIQTGTNVGIVLDGMYVLVDIDAPGDPVAQRWTGELDRLSTWTQATPRQHATPEARAASPAGRHWLVAAPPDLLASGAINGKIVGDDGVSIIGDIKVRGYCLAPGSEIECDDGVLRTYTALSSATQAPVEAPEWLVTYIQQRPWTGIGRGQSTAPINGAAIEGLERAGIPSGSHDDFLASLGGFLRARWGLGGAALEQGIAQGLPLLLDGDPARPYTKTDIERLARSCAKLEANPPSPTDSGPLLPENWISGDEVELIPPPLQWWIRHFVPHGELVMLYGEGGTGKSSWASLLAAEVTMRGETVAHVGMEEPFERFVLRAVLQGGDRKHIKGIPNANNLRFPRDHDMLERAIKMSGTKFLYFDSIMAHFDTPAGLHAGERAARVLRPLAAIAIRTGCTILAVFHENKSGEYMGSTEMINPCRYALRASRAINGPLKIAVRKTNFVMPEYSLRYKGVKTTATDPMTNATWEEVLEDGTKVPYQFILPQFEAQEPTEAAMPEEVVTDDMEPRKSSRVAKDGGNDSKWKG